MQRRIACSRYDRLPDDRAAVVLGSPAFPAHGDGVGDDAPSLQTAIDHLYAQCPGGGVIFVPAGRYRLGATVHLWRGMRLVGCGATRPTLVLAPRTPGFNGPQSAYLIRFGNRPPEPGQPPGDASNITFFSGIANIDMEIAPGNPMAVAVRFNVAQHSLLTHMDFRLTEAFAGVEQFGNLIEDCRFFGGRYGLKTVNNIGWQAMVLDCMFDGQTEAAISSANAGLTVARGRFQHVPHAVVVPAGATERCYISDSVLEDVAGSAVLLDRTDRPECQLNVENLGCSQVPVMLAFRGEAGGKVAAPAPSYVIDELSHGQHVACRDGVPAGREFTTRVRHHATEGVPVLPPRAFADLPPSGEWVNVREFGAVGDGKTDDTDALRRALAAGRAVYLPVGRYRLRDTLELGPDSALIGLHPFATMLCLDDGSAGFGDPDQPRAVLQSPRGGRSVCTGVGIEAGRNPGAVSLRWAAGAASLVDDVFFAWGGGAEPLLVQIDFLTAVASLKASGHVPRKGRDLLYTLWVDGGGGTFKNIWSPAILARNGLLVSDTDVPGCVYAMSVEHHVPEEVVLRHVRGWRFLALQTEENLGSEQSLALRLEQCRDVAFANLFLYRDSRIAVTHPHAVTVEGCRDIVFRGVHSFSGGCPFDHTVWIRDTGVGVAERELASLRVE